ncbi:MAG: hypothetical protein ABWW69_06555 [Pyrodictiaceae archaeon]
MRQLGNELLKCIDRVTKKCVSGKVKYCSLEALLKGLREILLKTNVLERHGLLVCDELLGDIESILHDLRPIASGIGVVLNLDALYSLLRSRSCTRDSTVNIIQVLEEAIKNLCYRL